MVIGNTHVVDAFYHFLDDYFQRPECLPLAEFAERAKISRMYLHKLRRKQSVPSLDVAESVANAAGTTLSKILNTPAKRA